MCGIFGYAGRINKEKYGLAYSFLKELGKESEARGIDSTGFSCKFRDTNIIVTDKLPYRASIFTKTSRKFRGLRRKMPEFFIGHTRLGTGSSPIINNNNHPFVGKHYHMIHNGVVPSWKNVRKEHELSMDSETDSEVIIRMLEKSRANGDRSLGSVENVLNKIWGNMAVALLDTNAPYIWLFRNENPIWVFQVPPKVFGDDVYFFASLATIFDDAWKTIFDSNPDKSGVESIYLKSNKLYSISPVQKLLDGDGLHKFVLYNMDIKSRFDRAKQYTSTGAITTRFYNQIKFYSKVIDADKPQLGLDLAESDVKEIRKKINEKDGKLKIRIDGLTINEFASLKTLVDDLYKTEMNYFLKNKMGDEDVQDICELSDKANGAEFEIGFGTTC